MNIAHFHGRDTADVKHESTSRKSSCDHRQCKAALQSPRRERVRHQLPNAVPVERNDEKKIEFTG